MTDAEFQKFKRQTEADILKLRKETVEIRKEAEKRSAAMQELIDRRLAATAKLLQMGAGMIVRIERKQDAFIEALINPRNGQKKKGSK